VSVSASLEKKRRRVLALSGYERISASVRVSLEEKRMSVLALASDEEIVKCECECES
jgi:hypothetical protein